MNLDFGEKGWKCQWKKTRKFGNLKQNRRPSIAHAQGVIPKILNSTFVKNANTGWIF